MKIMEMGIIFLSQKVYIFRNRLSEVKSKRKHGTEQGRRVTELKWVI